MKQLIKNELIKLRAQKTYLVLSCVVLALVIIVSFFTSVVLTPFRCFINDGREFITRSTGYGLVVDYIYDNPDSPLAGVLRRVFRDPKSEGDEAREQAKEYLEMEFFGDYENMLAQARFCDFADEHELPEWIRTQFRGQLVELYSWHGIVSGLKSGKYTEQMMRDDYSLQMVMYPSFAEFPYYIEYYYDRETGEDRYGYCRFDGTACDFSEVAQALIACLPACESEIARLEQQSLHMTADSYYLTYIYELDGKIKEQEEVIGQLEESLRDPTQTWTDTDKAYAEYQIAACQRKIDDYKRLTEAYQYLKDNGKQPDGRAFEIVSMVLPEVLSARRSALDNIAMADLPEEVDLLVLISKSSSGHQLRVLDKALVAIEYAYTNDIALEGMGDSSVKSTFINNLSTASFLLSAVTVVLASMILSREFATGTVRLWVIRPKTRTKLLGSKIATLFIYVISMMLICFGITYAFALVNHLIDLFFFGESTLFTPVYAVLFGKVVQIPAVLEHLWALVVITLPVLLYAMLCLFISVLTKKGVLGIVLGMIVLMFASDIQAVALVISNLTGAFGYVLHATVLPYLSMDALLGSAVDYAVTTAMNAMGLLDILNLESMLMGELWGAMPYVYSSLVGAIVLILHIALLILASLFTFKRTQIKS